jgi:hypothetical protein
MSAPAITPGAARRLLRAHATVCPGPRASLLRRFWASSSRWALPGRPRDARPAPAPGATPGRGTPAPRLQRREETRYIDPVSAPSRWPVLICRSMAGFEVSIEVMTTRGWQCPPVENNARQTPVPRGQRYG